MAGIIGSKKCQWCNKRFHKDKMLTYSRFARVGKYCPPCYIDKYGLDCYTHILKKVEAGLIDKTRIEYFKSFCKQ